MSLWRAMAGHRSPAAVCAIALLLPAAAAGQAYDHFPTGDPNDAKMLALAGPDYETLAEPAIHVTIAVPYGEDRFELGVFDGETGGRWDQGGAALVYELYYDPFQLDNQTSGDLVGSWSGKTMADNDWWSVTITVPDPAADPIRYPAPGESPAGTFFYHLKIFGEEFDSDPATVSTFKLRVESPARLLSRNFAFEGAMHLFPADFQTVFPNFDPGAIPQWGDTFWIDEALAGNTSYDGRWRFDLHLPYSQRALEIWDGDFDFGTNAAWPTCYPALLPMTWTCQDGDDGDTGPGDFPDFLRDPATGGPLDNCEPESAAAHGYPSDDSMMDPYRRGWCGGPAGLCQLQMAGCVRYLLRSPGPDGLQGTGDEIEFANPNPSSQKEWERFRISTRHPAVFDPLRPVAEQTDHLVDEILPAGVWQVEIEGVDLSNLNAWWTVYNQLPGYMLGDTVWHDKDGDGIQDRNEEGIRNVTLELIDENDQLLGSRQAGDPGSHPDPGWRACAARNTGGNTPDGRGFDDLGLYCFDVGVLDRTHDGPDTADYTVRIPAAELAPGGALYDHFGAVPLATTPSPEQFDSVVEEGGPVMTYDFGFVCPEIEACECDGKVTELTLRYLGSVAGAHVEVVQRNDGIKVYDGHVSPGNDFSFVGADKKGTLGPEIRVYVGGLLNAEIHTSCSQPIGPGLERGDFLVVAGSSRNGGALCPLGDDGANRDSHGGGIRHCVCPDDADSDSDSDSDGDSRGGSNRGGGGSGSRLPEICR